MKIRQRQLLFVFWLVPAVIGVLGLELVGLWYNPELSLSGKLESQLLMWLPWGVWSLLILAVCDRVPMTQRRFAWPLAVRGVLWVVVVIAQILFINAVGAWFGMNPMRPLTGELSLGIMQYGDTFTVIYWAIVGAHTAFRWQDALRAESVRTANLSADLALAKLDALQAELNPHFLFNALNSVVSLIAIDPPSAQRMIVRLADLLRSTLSLSADQEVPLHQELALVSQYLDIEMLRFPDRLGIKWNVEERTRALAVPPLVLQPIVENALIHGVGRLTGAGHVTIGARAVSTTLELTVHDNGPGPSTPAKTPGTGIGLRNLRERLMRLYGENARVTIADAAGGGCLVTLRLPLSIHDTALGGGASSGHDADRTGISRGTVQC